MTRDEFQAAAIAILGSTIGWQSRIGRALGVSARQVRRWVEADATPAWADEKLVALMGGIGKSPFPRDEWVIGDAVTKDGRRREYIVHLVHPRFSARIVETDDDGDLLPEHEPADILSGIVYSADPNTLICEVDWIDEPKAGEVPALMEAAATALDWVSDNL